jgi:hypothetical protein
MMIIANVHGMGYFMDTLVGSGIGLVLRWTATPMISIATAVDHHKVKSIVVR